MPDGEQDGKADEQPMPQQDPAQKEDAGGE